MTAVGTEALPRRALSALLTERRLPVLDGLRAIAVFTVIVYHFGFAVPGDLGVSVFFVLSGFLITWLLLKEFDASGRVSLRGFYARRMLRIFPAYYVFLAISLTLDHLRHTSWPPGLASAGVTYLVNYYNALHGHPTTSIAHAWSLSVEEQFYLLWPALLVLLLRHGRRALVLGLATLIIAGIAWRCYLVLVAQVGPAWVYNAFDTRFPNLGIGCLLAICAQRPAFDGLARSVARFSWLPLVTVALLVWSRLGFGSAYHYSLGFTVDDVLIAVLMVQLLLLHQSPLWSWLDHPIVRFLGAISYPLYLYHVWGVSVGHRLTGLPVALQFAAGVSASVVLASGSYFLVERPFLALKKRFERSAAHARPRFHGDTLERRGNASDVLHA